MAEEVADLFDWLLVCSFLFFLLTDESDDDELEDESEEELLDEELFLSVALESAECLQLGLLSVMDELAENGEDEEGEESLKPLLSDPGSGIWAATVAASADLVTGFSFDLTDADVDEEELESEEESQSKSELEPEPVSEPENDSDDDSEVEDDLANEFSVGLSVVSFVRFTSGWASSESESQDELELSSCLRFRLLG